MCIDISILLLCVTEIRMWYRQIDGAWCLHVACKPMCKQRIYDFCVWQKSGCDTNRLMELDVYTWPASQCVNKGYMTSILARDYDTSTEYIEQFHGVKCLHVAHRPICKQRTFGFCFSWILWHTHYRMSTDYDKPNKECLQNVIEQILPSKLVQVLARPCQGWNTNSQYTKWALYKLSYLLFRGFWTQYQKEGDSPCGNTWRKTTNEEWNLNYFLATTNFVFIIQV